MSEEEIPYFEIPVNTVVESNYSKSACYEFGRRYFELKKSIYRPEQFNIIYKECIDIAKIKYDNSADLPKLSINQQIIYIPNHFKKFFYGTSGEIIYSSCLHHNISIVYPISFMIMNTSISSLIMIAYGWKEFLLCDPTAFKAIAGPCERIVEYIESKFEGLQIECLHMTR